jgi:YlmC/YmxH family sporulation protein
MRLSELQHKDIVNLDGKKIGNIIDVKLNQDGTLISLVIETQKTLFRIGSKDNEEEISWDKIQRIGEDVILVKIN